MRQLLAVELTRLRWRRAVLLLLAAAVVVPTLIAATLIWDTRPPSQDDLDAARASAAPEIAQCEKRPGRFGVEDRALCEEQVVGWYTNSQPLKLGQQRSETGLAVVAVLTLLVMLAGTTFAGHDWNSGSMSNQLLFESRRGRVWAAKALVVLVTSFVVSAVMSATYWLALWMVARSRDLKVPDGVLADCLEFALRGSVFGAAAALGAFAMTMLFRSTVATVGVLFGVVLAGSLIFAALGISERWFPHKNVSAIIKDGTRYYVEVPQHCFTDGPIEGSECDQLRELTLVDGSLYYGVLLLGVGTASVLTFRRRDVP
ncbi:hypothetical protein NSZ01_19790 [Nocardioides szechwanensis]|uniref:ABC-2 family transporter protein n=1 Tax=Nocardioides szechwanensis TaxID=1005944 RepID=A0A1H0H8A3_9ACTN|nr:hypothetical protein [Nocardioides szechwanensis]GEP34211.1 hypothetical protein NSZ01_19790 [Nocardioides szechwanensis]SDO15300.1 hypothetical protein SAMN05192576_3494 [Nocardioides szechwanensis]